VGVPIQADEGEDYQHEKKGDEQSVDEVPGSSSRYSPMTNEDKPESNSEVSG